MNTVTGRLHIHWYAQVLGIYWPTGSKSITWSRLRDEPLVGLC